MEVFETDEGGPPAPPAPPGVRRNQQLSPAVLPYESNPPPPVLHLPPVVSQVPRENPTDNPWEAQPPGGLVMPPARRSARIADQLPSYFREQFSSETDSSSSSRSRDPDWRPPQERESSTSSGSGSGRPGQRLAAAANRFRQRISNAVSRRGADGNAPASEGGEETQLGDTFLRELLGAENPGEQATPQPPAPMDTEEGELDQRISEAAAAAAERRQEEAMELDGRPGSAASRRRRSSGRTREVDVSARNRNTLQQDRAARR